MDDPILPFVKSHRQHGAPDFSSASSETAHASDLENEGAANAPKREKDTVYVTWSGPDDSEHPRNWPLVTKLRVSLLLTLITLGVSVGSSIFGPGGQEVEEEFGISSEVAVLGTSLYLLV